jgi:hypothetical protein
MPSVSIIRYGARSQYPSQSRTALQRSELRGKLAETAPFPEITPISSVDYEVAIFSNCLGMVIPGLTSDRQLMAGFTHSENGQRRPFMAGIASSRRRPFTVSR